MVLERQLQLLGAVAVDVGHRETDEGQAPLGDQRCGRGNQFAGGVEDDVGRRGGPRHGVRPGGAAEVVEPQPQHHRAAGASGLAHPAGDPVDQVDHDGVDLRGRHRVAPPPEGALRADRAAAHARHHPAAIDVAGQRKQLTTHRAADHRGQRRLAELGDIGDRLDAVRVQLLGGLDADAPQPAHRQRMQERQLAIGRNQQQAVGFGLLAGHLGEELGAGDADGDRQADAVADLRARSCAAISTGVPDTRRRPETSRNASSTDSGSTTGVVSWNTSNTASLASEYADIRGGTTRACGHSAPGLAATHGGAHAVGLGFVARRQHDAAADDHRPAAQRGVVTLLDRRVERVEISVQDGGFRPPRRHEHMFASRSDS